MNLWTTPEYWSGKPWWDHYVFLGRHRDSSVLEISNFECALKELGGESDTVHVVCEHHWAVGWIEWIAIHKDDHKAVQKAEEIEAALENYPVLDEEDFSEREWRLAQETWEGLPLRDRVDLCSHNGISIFAARRDYIPPEDNGSIYEECTH